MTSLPPLRIDELPGRSLTNSSITELRAAISDDHSIDGEVSDMNEMTSFPDPHVRPLLHPIDVPDVRTLFVRAWWFARLASIPIAVAIGAIVWLLTGSLVAAILSPATTMVIGLVSSSWLQARAWESVPPERRAHDAPAHWELPATVFDGTALILAAAALATALTTRPVPDGVVVFALGSAAGIVLVQCVEILMAIRTHADHRRTARRSILTVAVLASSLILSTQVVGVEWNASLTLTAVLGAATALLAQAVGAAANRASGRRIRTNPATGVGRASSDVSDVRG
jgi:hypothetical protein